MNPADAFDTASRIARRIAGRALWQGETCTWEIRVSGAAHAGRSRPEPAAGELYQGSAGIAYFLAHWRSVAQRRGGVPEDEIERVGRLVRRALRHAIDWAAASPPRAWGFHAGRVGVAWAAARVAELLDAEGSEGATAKELRTAARDLLAPLRGREREDHGLDVIAGAAGAIPALLDLRGLLPAGAAEIEGEDGPNLLAMAEGLGRHLLESAHREPDAWAWSTLPRSTVRHLAGFAHGTAGIGVALLELARATGDGAFRFGAEMAFLYERRCFDAGRDNWPDWRNMALGELYRAGQVDRIREMLRQGRLPGYRKTFMSAWCHGAPGIGLSRLRAFELTGQQTYLEEAKAALRSTLDSLEAERGVAIANGRASGANGNYSLCHGAAGNAELVSMALRLLPQAAGPIEERALAEVAEHGRRHFELEHEAWSCGTLDGAADPSLLVGEAGIGLFYLRIADPDIPTPLLVRPEHQGRPELSIGGWQQQAEASVGTYFADTLARWHGLDPALEPPTIEPGPEPLDSAPTSRVADWIESILDQRAGSELGALLADASAVDRARFEASSELDDYTLEPLRELVRPAWDTAVGPADAPTARFRPAPHARVVIAGHDWAGWAASTSGADTRGADVGMGLGTGSRRSDAHTRGADGDTSTEDAPPKPSPTPWLLGRSNNRISARPIGNLAALVLDGLSEPGESIDSGIDLPTLTERVARAAGADPATASAQLGPLVRQQLEQLYLGGFVDRVSASQGADGD